MDPISSVAFSPHPDDAELYCAGTLAALARAGHSTGIIDVTRGELSTRGDLATRARETAAATEVLGLAARANLGIPDGDIVNSVEHRLRVVRLLRAWRPAMVFLPYPVDRHPDHGNTSVLVREAVFAAGLAKVETEVGGVAQAPHRPAKMWYYMLSEDFTPQVIVDVSATQTVKEAAIRCYASQFWTGAGDASESGLQTYISSEGFFEGLRGRARRLGFVIGAEYGEGFIAVQPLGVRAPTLFDLLP